MAGSEAGRRSMSILYRSDEPRAAAWASYFAKHAPDLDFRVWPDAGDLSGTAQPPELIRLAALARTTQTSGSLVAIPILAAASAIVPPRQ